MKFKVGDRVRSLHKGYAFKKLGTVKTVNHNDCGVQFDEYCYGHDLFGVGKDGFCWWIQKDKLQIVSKSPMVDIEKALWGVKYDRDVDPVEFFKSKAQAEKRISELMKEDDVDTDSIYLFEVGKVFKADLPVRYELRSVK